MRLTNNLVVGGDHRWRLLRRWRPAPRQLHSRTTNCLDGALHAGSVPIPPDSRRTAHSGEWPFVIYPFPPLALLTRHGHVSKQCPHWGGGGLQSFQFLSISQLVLYRLFDETRPTIANAADGRERAWLTSFALNLIDIFLFSQFLVLAASNRQDAHRTAYGDGLGWRRRTQDAKVNFDFVKSFDLAIDSLLLLCFDIGHARYCLFGNNVTLANKFESTSVPFRTNISPSTYEWVILSRFYISQRRNVYRVCFCYVLFFFFFFFSCWSPKWYNFKLQRWWEGGYVAPTVFEVKWSET